VIAEDVRRACSLPLDRRHAAAFDLDSSRLRPRGEDMLARVAACIVSGRLGDETITVVGHTDPRGDTSYQQQLGLYRAIAGKQYLVDLGVPEGRISTESLGARESRGTDDASWALDRTIEVRIARGPGDFYTPPER
jgi:peptidoglycan-associated lipoprotein